MRFASLTFIITTLALLGGTLAAPPTINCCCCDVKVQKTVCKKIPMSKQCYCTAVQCPTASNDIAVV
ncbi:Fc.00g110690.m01.CDS01 [Cosmosporella sp. VM-42]